MHGTDNRSFLLFLSRMGSNFFDTSWQDKKRRKWRCHPCCVCNGAEYCEIFSCRDECVPNQNGIFVVHVCGTEPQNHSWWSFRSTCVRTTLRIFLLLSPMLTSTHARTQARPMTRTMRNSVIVGMLYILSRYLSYMRD